MIGVIGTIFWHGLHAFFYFICVARKACMTRWLAECPDPSAHKGLEWLGSRICRELEGSIKSGFLPLFTFLGLPPFLFTREQTLQLSS